MKRKKKLPTRRRRALRCAGAALVLLLLVQNLLHTALLLPIQAVRLKEAQTGVRGTRVVHRQWEPGTYNGTGLFYLTANEEAVMLCDTVLTFRGWLPVYGALLDCGEDAPLHAAQRFLYKVDHPHDGGERQLRGTHYFFYGRVDDPDIETVEITLPEGSGLGEEPLAAPLFQKNGHRYFLLYRWAPGEEWPPQETGRAAGKDCEGSTVAEKPGSLQRAKNGGVLLGERGLPGFSAGGGSVHHRRPGLLQLPGLASASEGDGSGGCAVPGG